ncbi:PREDICTED: uncharacterized protein LOC109289344 [Gavialis gangeticus]|uniref:uncharacterized protein LOC109289344 n=1 Tax=Gavialis gangeticus TaxID=94835 RepID=UPI00092E9393|nr:PREDICTED: uncharacterized protein LOC109289344 [Gavialis gangeticus]
MAADLTLAIATAPGAAEPQPAAPQEPAGDRGTGAAGAAAAVPGPAARGPAVGEWPQGHAQPLTPAVAAAVTGGCFQQATHHEAALGWLQEALQAAEARTGQSQLAATETVQELQHAHASSQQELAAALGQADILRSSLEAARADSQRLQRESELVLADVRQWATEQKRANKRLGQKLWEQSKQLVRLTGAGAPAGGPGPAAAAEQASCSRSRAAAHYLRAPQGTPGPQRGCRGTVALAVAATARRRLRSCLCTTTASTSQHC